MRPTAAPAAPAAIPAAHVRVADFGTAEASRDARTLADRVMRSADHGGVAFAIVDKVAARLFVFAADGKLMGASPVLLGLARGDDSVPDIGTRKMADIRPGERTTPAGRFVSSPGQNLSGEHVVWVDYDAAVSMHAVRATVAKERRLERLESLDPAQHRISFGCINVPAAFFRQVAEPTFEHGGGVIYVLPETRSIDAQFPMLSPRSPSRS